MMKFSAIVLAGGYGNRLKGFRNPYRSKPLIRAKDGNFLLYHTLKELVLSNCIRDFHVTARIETQYLIENELKKFDVPYRIHLITGNERVREVLASLMEYMEDIPFFVVCGHAPPKYSHISRMGKFVLENGGQAVSCFRESKKHVSVRICDQTNMILDYYPDTAPICDNLLPLYQIDSPLLINEDTILRVRDDEYLYWYDRYLIQDIENGKKVGGFIADFPAEADTVDEIMKAIDILSDYS